MEALGACLVVVALIAARCLKDYLHAVYGYDRTKARGGQMIWAGGRWYERKKDLCG